MSGILAAQGAVCCCKPMPFAPCDYFEARAWYLANPTAFQFIQASVSAMALETRTHIAVPDTSCDQCYGKQSTESWMAGTAVLTRVPVTPPTGIFPTFARWESSWRDGGSLTQTPGQCDVTLGCCAGCCQPGGSNFDPFCIPNYQQPAWFCECCGGLCGCSRQWTAPQQSTYYYGCGNENYDLPSPCATCSSRTREYGQRVIAPLAAQPQFRLVVTIGGSMGLVCFDPAPGCPPPFVSGTFWRLMVQRRTVLTCQSGTVGTGDYSEAGIVTYVRTCCNYLAGPPGSYVYCGAQSDRAGSRTTTSGCDQTVTTWNYAATATVT